jgi:DNA modification methylase
MTSTLHLGDCLEVLRTMPDCSVDAVVTDPPYGLAFMGKRWDYDVPSVAIWAECLRVLKPGGHLLAFAGTRTQHRMAVRIEDAGFEIRDMIAWVYGSGFPKSLDVSKAIDKAAGAEREVVGQHRATAPGCNMRVSMTGCDYDKAGSITAPATPEAQQWAGWGTALKPSFESVTWATKPVDTMGYCAIILENLTELEAQCLQNANAAASSSRPTQAGSPEAKIGFAQEPAATQHGGEQERKTATGAAGATSSPVDTSASTLAAASIAWSIASSWRHTLEGVYARGRTSTTETESKTTTDWKTLSCCLSQITPESIIQACSLPGGFSANASTAAQIFNASLASLQSTLTLSAIEPATWQALDGSLAEAVKPNVDPVVMARKPLAGTVAANVLEHGTGALNVDECRVGTNDGLGRPYGGDNKVYGSYGMERGTRTGDALTGRWPANFCHDGSDEVVGLFPQTASGDLTPYLNQSRNGHAGVNSEWKTVTRAGDSGSAARFFYTAKASKDDRDDGNTHPTVKPTDLMRYLCRLVTPPGGVVLDPFMGSGSTGKAAMLEGFGFIGIEREPAYHAIAEQRISRAQAAGHQPDLFAGVAA